MRYLFLLCLTLLLAAPLGGCGKKPSFVDPPAVDAKGERMTYEQIHGPDGRPDTPGKRDGQKPVKRPDDFPHTYPKPWL